MQSINAGFQLLKSLVRPRTGDKLSKAAILQHAVDYISDLHRQKKELATKNERLMQLLVSGGLGVAGDVAVVTSARHFPPPPAQSMSRRRARRDDDDADDDDDTAAPSPGPPAPKRRRAETAVASGAGGSVTAAGPRSSLLSAAEEGARMPSIQLTSHPDAAVEFDASRRSASDVVGGVSLDQRVPSLLAIPVVGARAGCGMDLFAAADIVDRQPKADPDAVAVFCPSVVSSVHSVPVQVHLPDVELKPQLELKPFQSSSFNSHQNLAYPSDCPSSSFGGYWTSSASTTADQQFGSTSRRNLDTILEAIRHLEGEQGVRTVSTDASSDASNTDEEDVLHQRHSASGSSCVPLSLPAVKSCVTVHGS